MRLPTSGMISAMPGMSGPRSSRLNVPFPVSMVWSWSAMAVRLEGLLVEDAGVGPEFSAGHGVEEAGEGDVVEHLAELGRHVGPHGMAAAGRGHVPRLAAAPLEH